MERFAAGAGAPVCAALDALATRMGLGLLLIDRQGHPRFCNRTALDLLGCGEADGLDERWAELQAVSISTDTRAAGGASLAFTADLPQNGSIRFLRGESRPTDDGQEVFLKDRRNLGELDLELLCASRMREWIHQCDALVHDANGAVNTIQLTLELLDGQWPGSMAGEQAREPHRRNHVSVIRDNLEKLKGTLRKLAGAHDAAPAAVDIDLRDLVHETAATLRMPARRRRIGLDVQVGDRPLRIRSNRARVRQALVNVALSRLECMAERSTLVLEANASPRGIELLCRDDGELSGSDRAGIYRILPAEFAAGSSTDSLRLARAIVEFEAGEFQVRSEAGEGTSFRFVFPAARA